MLKMKQTLLSLISKTFWKHVKSFYKSTRIPETAWYGDCFRNNHADQANILNKLFLEQFSNESKYYLNIAMSSIDRFEDLCFYELYVQILLKNINSGKAAGPDGIHGVVLNKLVL